MNLPAPQGWTVYGGADGFDAIPDANGYLWWGDDMWLTGKDRNETWQFILCRYKNGVSERIPLPEYLNGAGRLNWTPIGLTVSVSHNESNGTVTNKTFSVPQYVQFSAGVPVIVQVSNGAVSAVDIQARAMAQDATKLAQHAQNDVEQTALARPTIAQTKTLIEDRLKTFLIALRDNNRADKVNALWMDVMFKKTNDWIYGWMKDRGFVQ